MVFDIDKQTIKDIELFPEKGNDYSIFSFYDRTSTAGGQEKLYKYFKTPISDLEILANRKLEIEFFFNANCLLQLKARQIDFIEHYLRNRRVPLKDHIIDATANWLSNKLKPNGDYYIITEGISYIIYLLIDLDSYLKQIETLVIPKPLAHQFLILKEFISRNPLKEIIINTSKKTQNLSFSLINKLDYYFRVKRKNAFREVLDIVYEIDVLQALSQLMKQESLTLPEFMSDSIPTFEVVDCFHPFLNNPVSNSFSFNSNKTLCFLTGPNMSGKSTFLKSIGLIIYLAHLGFPVPAKQLRTSLFNGLFTTINLSDSLNLGYSHFYSEVKRVKDIAIKIKTTENIVVIFDELFRGTNVKDAYDATLMIISALSRIKGNFFFISTHLLEVAESLNHQNRITFKCFESNLKNQKPVYDFKLKEGISKERIGISIIKNEKINDIFDQIIRDQEV